MDETSESVLQFQPTPNPPGGRVPLGGPGDQSVHACQK